MEAGDGDSGSSEQHHGRPKTISEWNAVWDKRGDPEFHLGQVSEYLKMYKDVVLSPNAIKPCTVLVPLCGKTVDMKWLYDRGHIIIGVDCSEVACQQFLTENKITYSVVNEETGPVYKSTDGRVVLYISDILAVNKNGKLTSSCDSCYDTGAFVTMLREDREKYRDVMLQLMKPKGSVLLEIINLTEDDMKEMPEEVTEKDVYAVFGDSCQIQVVGEGMWTKPSQPHFQMPLKFFSLVKKD